LIELLVRIDVRKPYTTHELTKSWDIHVIEVQDFIVTDSDVWDVLAIPGANYLYPG